MGKKEINVELVYLFVNQFDSFVSFLIQEKEIEKSVMEDYLINILKDNRGSNGQNNFTATATEGDLPMGIPMETTTSEPTSTIEKQSWDTVEGMLNI